MKARLPWKPPPLLLGWSCTIGRAVDMASIPLTEVSQFNVVGVGFENCARRQLLVMGHPTELFEQLQVCDVLYAPLT